MVWIAGLLAALFAGIMDPAYAQSREKLSAGAIVGDAASSTAAQAFRMGAERMEEYLPMLQGKRVALLVNQTSRVVTTLLPDTLLRRGVKVVKLFVPEHGFRGTSDAGAHVASGKDTKTGLPIISLYGANKKPTAGQMSDVDVLLYDLQDVGARFYTYISTLQYAMEACAEKGIPIVVLDRSNPNARSIGGPVLDTAFRSFVGMQPIPILYGMTVGEYAKMLVGERWFPSAGNANLTVVPCSEYDPSVPRAPAVAPSPNLRTLNAMLAYGWTCLFEGTVVSVGRGTEKPFEQWGHPAFAGKPAVDAQFTPLSTSGASEPVLEGRKCFGRLVVTGTKAAEGKGLGLGPVNLTALVTAYQWYPDKKKFFNSFFEKLAGTAKLRAQIEQGMTAEQIAASWTQELEQFKLIRKKYLLYPDKGE